MTIQQFSGLQSQNQRLTYQKFNAGEITSTTVVLSKNENGANAIGNPLDFDSSNVSSITPIIVLQSDYETGVNDSSGNRITVQSISGATVTLSAVPVNNVAVAIWYGYLEPKPAKVKDAKAISPNIENNRIIEILGGNLDEALNSVREVVDEVATKITKVSSPTSGDVAKINSNGEIENSAVQYNEIELNTNKVASFSGTPGNTKYPTEKLVKDNLDSLLETVIKKANTNDLKQSSTLFVNAGFGHDTSNNGQSPDQAFATVGKAWSVVTSSGDVQIQGADTHSVNHTFSNSLTSVKTTISNAAKISGTVEIVNGNTSMYFFGGMMDATVTAGSGTTYFDGVNVGGATFNFNNGGYKVIKDSTSPPTAINLTGSAGGILLIENVSGGSIPINIGTGWIVYVVNSLLAIGTRNGLIVEASITINIVLESQLSLNAILTVTNNSIDGLYIVNFDNPSITGLTLVKGDIIYKVGSTVTLAYTFLSAPPAVQRAPASTTREVYYKDVSNWKKFFNPATDIINDLVSTNVDKSLSANMGKELKDLVDEKAMKDTDAVTNNLAIFDSDGNPVDSGTNVANLNDGWDGEVNTFANLPSASTNDGNKYIVKTPTGTIILGTKKYAGTYISDGTNWNIFGYKQASVINQLLASFAVANSNSTITASDSILSAFGKLQKYINDFLVNFDEAGQLIKLDSNGKIPSSILSEGIANGDIPVVDSTSIQENDIAQWTITGLKGRSITELQSDLGIGILQDDLHCNDKQINLRGTGNDVNHFIKYNSSVDGVQIKSYDTTLISDFCKFEGSKSLTKNFGWLNSSGNTGSATNYTANFSAEFSNRILADEFNATSDKRIKKIIGVSDSKKDLDILKKIEITDFSYIDTIAKGNGIKKKVIAQQVEEHFPQAVSKVEGAIPSVYKPCKIEENKIFIKTTNYNFELNSKLQIIIENKGGVENCNVTIKEIDSNFVVVDKLFKNEKVFVYGEIVKDFKVVDYEEIAMLAVSVIQEQSKNIERLSKDVEELKLKFNILKNEK